MAHSMGGLVAREYILRRQHLTRPQLKVTNVVLLATPNNGSELSELGRLVSPSRQIEELRHIDQGNTYLESLNNDWNREFKVEGHPRHVLMYAGYEGLPMPVFGKIVKLSSAIQYADGSIEFHEDHFSIAKPKDRNDLYIWVKAKLEEPFPLITTAETTGSVKTEPQSKEFASLQKPPEGLTALPSLLSLFMTDFEGKGSGGGVNVSSVLFTDLTFEDNTRLRIIYKIIDDYGSRSKFLSFYIPSSPHTYEAIEFFATGYKKHLNSPKFESGTASSPSVTKGSELVFTGRVFIYHEKTLTLSELGKLDDVYRKQGLNPLFYSTTYALSALESMRSGNVKPLPKYELRDGIPGKVADPNADK